MRRVEDGWLGPWCMAIVLAAPACDRDEPAILGYAQEIVLDEVARAEPNQVSVVVAAHATSRLPVAFGTNTLDVCSVDSVTGAVTAKKSGICSVVVNQEGNTEYSPATPVTAEIVFSLSVPLAFSRSPALNLYDLATVRATGPAEVMIRYSSETPSVCAVDEESGLVVASTVGTCILVASGAGQTVSQSIEVTRPPESVGAPLAPLGVTARLTEAVNRVSIGVESLKSGGSPITGYSIASVPPGITANVATLPTTVTCPSGCAGYAFQVAALNQVGGGPRSGVTEIITRYQTKVVFFEPDCQPNDSIFLGEYTLNSTTGSVSGLKGRLSESMTGSLVPYPNDTMTWLGLEHQLSSLPVTTGGSSGLLVTSFLLDHTDTLSNSPGLGGTDGWQPGTGRGLYFGYPAENGGNAYVRIFVNTADPLAKVTDEQVAMLAYADCTKGGMMGAVCMTGTSVAGYGFIGTMSGYPLSQSTELLGK